MRLQKHLPRRLHRIPRPAQQQCIRAAGFGARLLVRRHAGAFPGERRQPPASSPASLWHHRKRALHAGVASHLPAATPPSLLCLQWGHNSRHCWCFSAPAPNHPRVCLLSIAAAGLQCVGYSRRCHDQFFAAHWLQQLICSGQPSRGCEHSPCPAQPLPCTAPALTRPAASPCVARCPAFHVFLRPPARCWCPLLGEPLQAVAELRHPFGCAGKSVRRSASLGAACACFGA